MLLPNAKPGTSRENKTGDWRTFRPVVDKEKCVKCGKCAMFCPEGCISGVEVSDIKKRDFPKVDYDYCKGCGICANECPVKAIRMVAEEK